MTGATGFDLSATYRRNPSAADLVGQRVIGDKLLERGIDPRAEEIDDLAGVALVQ
jgi:hypothetical protein